MRFLVPSLLALSCVAAEQPEIPVTGVVLYSSGVGYFEHSGAVEGVATAQLRFKAAQINDVLKSLILQDLDGGKIGTVVYPSQDPLEKTLGSFQVDLRGNPSLAQVLGQLRGAVVAVTWQAEKLSGTIVGVETRTRILGDKQTVVVPVLTLAGEQGIRQVPLDEVGGIVLADAKLQTELTRALAAVANARDQDSKPVDLRFDGQGKRRIKLGYVVEAPLWKVSYRMVMPEVGKDQGQVQGWALVENQTQSDWNNVRLTLVSGRPISFIQDLYRPLYLPRPTVEPELYASLRPQSYDQGMSEEKEGLADNRVLRGRAMKSQAMAAPASAPMELAGAEADRMAIGSVASLDLTTSVQSIAQAAEVGVLFQYAVPDVVLPRQRSAMLPIITDSISIERVSIYNQGVQAKHPLNGAVVVNSTSKHLPAGPLTVFDGGAYAGDAQVGQLPPGERRLLSYAIDIPVTVDAKAVQQESVITTAKVVEGVLWTKQARAATQQYLLANSSDTVRVVIVEHPRRPGWTLAEPAKPWETTDTLQRCRVSVPAGKEATLLVRETIVDEERFAVLDLSTDHLAWYAGNGAIPPKVRTALQQAAELKSQMTAAGRLQEQKQGEIQAIVKDQDRLRENMRTVNQNSDYYRRLLTKLNDQETKVETLQGEREKLHADAEAKRTALADFLRTLTVE